MWKRRFMTSAENAENVVYNPERGLYHSIMREPSMVDEFYFEKTTPSDDCIESVSHVDPIVMLFNQQRLEQLGEMGVKAFLDSLQQKDDSLLELRKKLTDDQLMDMMKSRYLQTPSEITAYCRYIEGNVDAFNKEVQQYVEQKTQQTQQQVESPNVEPQTLE